MSALTIRNLNKKYRNGVFALTDIHLDVNSGEIFALLGPNGAGKTTLINSICGIVTPTNGEIRVEGHDIIRDFRRTRTLIGLVPQELTLDAFESVFSTVRFSRQLFGRSADDAFLEDLLKRLSLWDKKDSPLMTLSGGMKRRAMIAKALSHEPRVLFLDEPTAGVDVNLRKDMWEQVRQLRQTGVTIILTTHYIEEAEEMADRIGVINHGKIIVTEQKHALMKQLARKRLTIDLVTPLASIPDSLAPWKLELKDDGSRLVYHYDSNQRDNGVDDLLGAISKQGLAFHDMHTRQDSLEEIFIQLVNAK